MNLLENRAAMQISQEKEGGGGAAFLRKNFHVQEIYALATVFGLSLLIISSWFDIS